MEKGTRKKLIYTGILTLGLSGLSYFMNGQEHVLLDANGIALTEPGEGEQEVSLHVEDKKLKESIPYTVTVGERDYTREEQEAAYEQAKKEIAQVFFAEGESASHVSKPVHPVDTLLDGSIGVSWDFGDSLVMEADGTIQEEYVSEAGTLVQARATLSHGTWECIYTFPFVVYPAGVSDRDALIQLLDKRIGEQESTEGEILHLPAEVAGHELHWQETGSDTHWMILLLGAAAGGLVILSEREQKRKEKEQWRQQMIAAYPQLVAKMSLMTGAGMSVRQAWMRLAEGMQCEKLREQMQITLRQMEDGEGELRAYEQFGERSGITQYRRFAMLLIQNLQKGNSGLRKAMQEEAERAFEDRKNQARRLGEEAGTKLMLPMMLMLGIVFAILMIPALLNMQIG